MADELDGILVAAVQTELDRSSRGRSLWSRRDRLSPRRSTLAFGPRIDEAVERMHRENRLDDASIDLARTNFARLTRIAADSAAQHGSSIVRPDDIQVAMRDLCPLWPVC